MRILVFAALYHPFKGGYVESIHGLCLRLVARGHAVTICTSNTHNAPHEEERDGVRIIRIPCYNPAWLNHTCPIPKVIPMMRVWQMLRGQSFDIVSTQTRFFPTTIFGFLFAQFHDIPVIHTERGGQHTASLNPLIRWVGVAIDHTIGWIVCRFSDQVVGVSRAACDFVRHLGARNPLCIYNGVDVAEWDVSDAAPSRPTITFVGRLIAGKGVQDLIHVMPHIPDIYLSVVGGGPYQSALSFLARRLHVSRRIVFHGECTHLEIKNIFKETTVFVNPSYSEGFPRSVLEAAAAGLPIIATDVGGTGEIVQHAESGMLIQAGTPAAIVDSIRILMGREDMRRQLGNAAQMSAKRFAWDDIVKRYEDLYVRYCR